MSQTDQKLRLAVILGSVRPERFCDRVAQWVLREVARDGAFETEVIDPAALDLWHALTQGERAVTQQLAMRIQRADAFIFVTPEYNHGYPAALKVLIDACYHEWQAKPVAFVSYGGASGGSRAVEQLRQVVAELHMVSVRDTVSFANCWDRFTEEGVLSEPERAERAMGTLLARLRWWSLTLKRGRQAAAYDTAVSQAA